MHILDELQARGMIHQMTHEAELKDILSEGSTAFYVGFDPTAKSLHIGSLVPMMAMAFLQRAGHRPIAVVGGATGMVGDPSGRSSERNLQGPEQIEENLQGIRQQLQQFLRFEGDNAAELVNNADWTAQISYIDWLRDVGKYLTVNYMMAKESVRRRLEDRDQGISYTEFSYMLLQAHDFLHLYRAKGCKIQAGGSDQWGNITAGTDLIHKAEGGQAYGMTFPLVTTSSGEKFGKSAGNAVWLDPDMTSPYNFYQYWMQTEDNDVDRFLKLFTFLSLEEIAEITAAHLEKPEPREGQRRLAEEVTRVVHGDEAVRKVQLASEVLFGREIKGLSDADLAGIFPDVPSTEFEKQQLGEITLLQVLRDTGLAKSNGEARRLVQGGGVYLNNNKCSDGQLVLQAEHLASETTMVLRSGKKKYHLARFV